MTPSLPHERTMVWFWGGLTVAGYLLTLALIPAVLLDQRKQAVATVAWILAILLMPVFGGLLYLLFGINRVSRRAALRRASLERIGGHLPGLSEYHLLSIEGADASPHLIRMAQRVAGTRPTFGNRVDLFHDTRQTFRILEQELQAARTSLHLEYYIWEPDRTGTRLRDLLIEQAKSGVTVRFLYDRLGSLSLSRRFLRPMLQAGIRVASFLPGPSWREQWSFNLRNHRKIVVVDGQVGFTGGVNIADDYLGLNPRLGHWRDTHARLRGPAVLQLQQIFVEDWYFATGEDLTSPAMFPPPAETGDHIVQAVAGGPDGELFAFQAIFFAALNAAQTQISLTTSYFVPTPALELALASAALRGVRVRILVPARNIYWPMQLAAQSYYSSLLASGVEIYEYHGGLLHAKTLTIDHAWSLVGSPNFDPRSLLLNFEAGVILYDRSLADQLEQQFERDLADARRVDRAAWDRRPVYHVAAENLVKLFSPVL